MVASMQIRTIVYIRVYFLDQSNDLTKDSTVRISSEMEIIKNRDWHIIIIIIIITIEDLYIFPFHRYNMKYAYPRPVRSIDRLTVIKD